MPKRYILSAIYFAPRVVFALFFFLPLSAWTVYAFAIALGLLWLSTVPPTNGIVAQIFGVRYLAMLSGFTFFSHQIGSFLGAWLGGRLYDTTGSYDIVWCLAIALGVVAGLINLPIDEREIERPRQSARELRRQRRRGRQRVGGDVIDGVGDDAVHAPRRELFDALEIVRRISQHAIPGAVRVR